ncbi:MULTISPECIES: ROK family protein [unclassified Micromonospora]|uniref:ROK family protein n=2 Tax=unclassified Micromonospora TaxID=2617518 RepID=UPI0022B64DB5|nr:MULTISPECIES: ROK family protein [unclassified Micromonospora]MCZ7419356.1 ROK family protein [Verrucosispora sp. WMMA2121]WBB93002.1 ROK family protein [Verrucosispora sp. WMMC514]
MTEEVAVALDVGGTGMKCALVGVDGVVRHAERHPTDAGRGPDAVVETILSVAEGLAGKAYADGLTPTALGIVVPGVVDEARGVAVWSANVGFRDVPLRDLAAARLGLPTALGHDVRAGGLAEARLGAGRDTGHVLFVAIGTGIAAAHVVAGRAVTGAHGAAGELGHILVRPDGPVCGCGRPGCLEAVASASAVARRYAELTGTGTAGDTGTATTRRTGSASDDGSAAGSGRGRTMVTAAEVAARADAGEKVAAQVWRETVEALADGLATAQALFDVATIVLGGGLAQAGAGLFDPLRAALRDRLTFHREPRLVPAVLGDEAGCLGAALLALDQMETP